MPRKRVLDRYVSVFVDRHGKERFRFRRDGQSLYLPPPGTKEYKEAYSKALNGVAGLSKARPGTVADLVARYYQSIPFRRAGPSWQTTQRQVLESFRDQYGAADVAEFKPSDISLIVSRKMDQTVTEKGKKIGGTHAAERMREVLVRLFEFAVSEEMAERNVAKLSHKVGHKPKGYYTWTEGDIAKYRERWPLGTKARLALELMLWTGSRRGNAHKMKPPVDGRFKAVAVKTGAEIDMPVKPPLQAAIDAMPEGSIGETLIVTEHGKPFSAAGFGNKMREWCNAAGLPKCTAHGLRKALTTRGANIGLSQQELKALGQWKGDDEVKTYAANADRKRLAESALDRIAEWEQSENIV
jgi:integrase